MTGSGIHGHVGLLDDHRIAKRSRMIPLAIDARRQQYPDETSFIYKPLADLKVKWDGTARAAIADYNALDLSI